MTEEHTPDKLTYCRDTYIEHKYVRRDTHGTDLLRYIDMGHTWANLHRDAHTVKDT